jgi:hypothetical protein
MSVKWIAQDDGPLVTENDLENAPEGYDLNVGDPAMSIADPATLPENVSEYVSKMRNGLNVLSQKEGVFSTSKEKSGNVHPLRYAINKRGSDVIITRTDDARDALRSGGQTVTRESLGF